MSDFIMKDTDQQMSDKCINDNTAWQHKLLNSANKFLHWVITLDTYDGSEKIYTHMTETSNYVFFFGGTLRTVTKSRLYSVLVFCSLIVPLALFSIFECRHLWYHSHGLHLRTLIIVFYYFNLLTASSFFRAACSDPGVVSRNVHMPGMALAYQIPREYYNHVILPSENQSAVITMKYCQTCRIWRPPRSSHCPVCDVCVLTHDHHCIWLGNCIGQRNYRFFIAFLISSIIACLLQVALSAIRLSNVTHPSKAPVSILLICYCGLGVQYPLILFLYHIFLTGTQQTTHEYLRSIGSKNPIFHKITRDRNSPYDRGSFSKNLIHLMFQERGWILVDPTKTQRYPRDVRFQRIPEAHTMENI